MKVDPPCGVDVLEYLDTLEPFEIFSGKGFLGPDAWALLLDGDPDEDDREVRWTII